VVIVEFDKGLKMPICSRYGTDLFQRYFCPDGRTYNVWLLYYQYSYWKNILNFMLYWNCGHILVSDSALLTLFTL